MKRKYPKDNDTIKTIKDWLTKNKVDYKWKSKRKPELLEIMHQAIIAVKKRNKEYADLSIDDMPSIIIRQNQKGKLTAKINSVTKTNINDVKSIENKDTDVFKKAVETSHQAKADNNNANLVKEIIKHTNQTDTQTDINSDTKPQPEITKSSLSNGLKLDLSNNEWLLILTLPKDIPANSILNLNTGEISIDNQVEQSDNNSTKNINNKQEDIDQTDTSTTSHDNKVTPKAVLNKYQMHADSVDVYHENDKSTIAKTAIAKPATTPNNDKNEQHDKKTTTNTREQKPELTTSKDKKRKQILEIVGIIAIIAIIATIVIINL